MREPNELHDHSTGGAIDQDGDDHDAPRLENDWVLERKGELHFPRHDQGSAQAHSAPQSTPIQQYLSLESESISGLVHYRSA